MKNFLKMNFFLWIDENWKNTKKSEKSWENALSTIFNMGFSQGPWKILNFAPLWAENSAGAQDFIEKIRKKRVFCVSWRIGQFSHKSKNKAAGAQVFFDFRTFRKNGKIFWGPIFSIFFVIFWRSGKIDFFNFFRFFE